MKIITAKFAGTCYQTNRVINAGTKYLYDGNLKLAYHFMAPITAIFIKVQEAARAKEKAAKEAEATANNFVI